MVGALAAPELRGAVLVVDQTGVGRAVVDLLAAGPAVAVGCRLLPVTITSGRAVGRGTAGGVRVPKRLPVGTLRGVLAARRLVVAHGLPDAAALAAVLAAFQARVTAAAHLTFGARGPTWARVLDWQRVDSYSRLIAMSIIPRRLAGLRPWAGADASRVEAVGLDAGNPDPARAAVVGRLTPRQRETVEPLFVEGLTLAEAAARMGIVVRAVRALRDRAPFNLRRWIGRPRRPAT